MAAIATNYFETGRSLGQRISQRNAELLEMQPLRRRGVWTPEFLGTIQKLTKTVAADPRVGKVNSLWTLAQAAGISAAQFSQLTAAEVKAHPKFAALIE